MYYICPEMPEAAPVSVRLPYRSLSLLQEAADVHGVSRHRLMEAVLRYAARDPGSIVRQALIESPDKRELAQIVNRIGRKV
jgi:hypothetical protein